jgi:hypothetical protein
VAAPQTPPVNWQRIVDLAPFELDVPPTPTGKPGGRGANR